MESGRQKGAANGSFTLRPWQRTYAFAEGGKCIGKAVVAVDARHFFNQIDLTLEVEAPAGQGDLP